MWDCNEEVGLPEVLVQGWDCGSREGIMTLLKVQLTWIGCDPQRW